MKNFGTYFILMMIILVCWSGGSAIVLGSEQGRLIREVKPGKEAAPPGEKVVVEEKAAEEKVVPVKVLEPCMVAEMQPVTEQGPGGVVAGDDKLIDVQVVVADTDIKPWLIAGGVVLLVIIGVAILSTRKVMID